MKSIVMSIVTAMRTLKSHNSDIGYRQRGVTDYLFEVCAVLGYYPESNGSPLPTFRDNLSVKNYHSTLGSTQKERRCHQYRGGSLKSRIVLFV
jgi:hypothetical protein